MKKWKDHYKTLNIPFNSDHAEIKRAYRKLAHKYHPDKNTDQNKKTAEYLFRQVTESYKLLTNPLLKREYDEMYQKRQKKQATEAKAHQSKTKSKKKSQKTTGKSSFQDLVKNVFNNATEETITQTMKTRNQTQTYISKKVKQGRHLKYQLNLTFEEICDGCEKTITFIRKRKNKNESATLRIKVPAGVTKGKQLRLKGEGDEGVGLFGDLLVVINVLTHDLFKVKGHHAYLDLPVSYRQAVMGAKIKIPTLRGVHNLTIPPVTKHGTVLYLKGEGFKASNELGDLFINIHIDIPKDLTPIAKHRLVEFDRSINHTLPSAFQKTLSQRKA